MSIIDELITTHQQSEYYGAEDLNRAGKAMKYVVSHLREMGWTIRDVNPKCDWGKNDIPQQEQIQRYLSELSPIVICLASNMPMITWPDPPSGARPWTAEEANAIEQLLADANDMCTRIKASWQYSGDLIAGEGGK